MFEGDKETFAQAVRNECMCGPDGDLSDWDRTWNEMWQSVFSQEIKPDKESIETLLGVMLDSQLEAWEDEGEVDEDEFEERQEHLSGLIDHWRTAPDARSYVVDAISEEVFRDIAEDMNFSDFESVLGSNPNYEMDRLEIAIANGLDIHARDKDQATLLHHCSSMKPAKFLVDNEVDPRIGDKDGDLASDWAKVNGLYKLAVLYDSKSTELDAIDHAAALKDRHGISNTSPRRGHEIAL